MMKYDVIVLGLGAMGSAAAYQLAKRGRKVLGLDQYAPPHIYGSTHGDTRITRLAIGEGDWYSPLAIRSHEIWREIEAQTGARLLAENGGLIISSAAKAGRNHVENFFKNTVAAAEKYKIPHEILNATQIRERFPPFNVKDDETGYYEPSAGFLRPEECIRAQLKLAGKHGADIHVNEKAQGFDASSKGVTVRTDKDSYSADKLILTAGPWLPGLLGGKHDSCFKVFRQVLFWFDVHGDITPWLPENFPIFIWETQGAAQGIYGFPAIDGPRGGVKIATGQYESTTTPETVDRDVSAEETAATYEGGVAPFFPGLAPRCVKSAVCLYTVTPDSGFVIDTHPDSDRVIIASPCSGHGFKHSAAIGEALADLSTEGKSRFDLSAFRLARFAGP